jgi:hypothetical protein
MGMQNQERSRDVQVKQDNCIAVSDCSVDIIVTKESLQSG